MNKHYKNLDLIRVLACLAILFYHIGLLKGGYLAVCTFFVLTGYLSIVSSFKKEHFSLKEYYIGKFKRIYLPLLVVVFTAIAVISLVGIDYVNLKPETTSVLLGYNNYWQLNANLDYFVRHISSPFMHLWYIAILLQFELVFPFIYVTLKTIGKKTCKWVPCVILALLGALSYLFFYDGVSNGNLMSAYYGTFTRAFSILFGLLLGLIHVYYKPAVLKGEIYKYIFGLYILALGIIFYLVDFKSNFFTASMLITTLISMRLIDYSTLCVKEKNVFDKIIAFFSSISYEVYLVQYPVIFLIQSMNIGFSLKVIFMLIATMIFACIIKTGMHVKKKFLNIVLCIIISITSLYGGYQYIIAKDYTADMKKLEADLNKNQELMKQKQKEYEAQVQKEQEEWDSILNDFEDDAEKLKEKIEDLRVVGVGDSVMELAVKNLYKQFPNGYFDAVVNRTERAAADVINDLYSKNMLGDILIVNIGTNGDCGTKYKEKIAEATHGKPTLWLNATHADCSSFNEDLYKVVDKYDNIHIVDWVSVVKDHPEYVVSDKVHPSVKGCKVYTETIYNAIYEQYLKEIEARKEEKIKEHEELENKKITFVGNDLLLGLYDYISDDYKDAEFIIDKEFTFKSLKKALKEEIDNNNLNHNLVFVLSKKIEMTDTQYEEIIKQCQDYNIYIVDITNSLKLDGINLINFKLDKGYTTIDGKYLSDAGNKALKKEIELNLKK